jgi:hypothetical protein
MTAPIIGRPPPVVRLPLRDELYLLAHDDNTGAPRLHVGSLTIGLAGATLVELLLAGRVTLWDGRIKNEYVDRQGDHIAEAAMAQLRGGPTLPYVAPWLRAHASAELYERVRANLHAVGILRRTARRLRPDLYPPVHPVWTVWARGRIRSVLYGYEQPDAQCAALCGLVDVLGIHESLSLSEPPPQLRHALRVITTGHLLPVRHVIGQVAEVVGDLATAVYR